ncbi:MAG: HTH domain-containing protein [Polyangiaceae bacterium]|nr:HTH domain-containing protein [Polyangiaceae bacterium]
MTFTEAAAKVLRLVGKPLHYKEITDVAIEKNFLSHVGKSPEVTMGARLAALVKKGEKDNPLIRIKPGVFALRDWDQSTIDKGLADRTPAINMIHDGLEAGNGVGDHNGHASGAPPDDLPGPDEEEVKRAQFAAGGQQLFSTEDDDEEPILGGPDPVAAPADGGDEDGRRPRRNRRRRRGDEDRSGLPSYTVSDAPIEAVVAALGESSALSATEEGTLRPDFADGPRQQRERGLESRRPPDEGRRDRDEGRRGRDDGRRDESRREEGRRDDSRRDEAIPAGDELVGAELADVLEQLLQSRGRGMAPLRALADAAMRKGRVVDAQSAEGVVHACLRADNTRRQRDGQRPRFRINSGRVGLVESQDGELGRLERDIFALTTRYRELARRVLLRQLTAMPPRALGELVQVALEQAQVRSLRPVRRPGAPPSELHFAGRLHSETGEVSVALVIRRDGREVGRERVSELRGTLHHYGSAQVGMIVTLGQILSGAREEASAPGAAAVHLMDGMGLARLLEQADIGVQRIKVELASPDYDLFESLRGN